VFSPGGTLLASGSHDTTIKLWDVATGRELQRLSGHTSAVVAVAFSLDGRKLASAGGDGTVRLWDPAAGKELQTLTGHSGWLWSVAFAPYGSLLASGSWEGVIKFWDAETGRQVASLPGQVVAFSPDGGKLAYTMDKDVYVGDLHAYDEEIQRWSSGARAEGD
jgi:WD40 repeat protein